jgi:hypothetical protein
MLMGNITGSVKETHRDKWGQGGQASHRDIDMSNTN